MSVSFLVVSTTNKSSLREEGFVLEHGVKAQSSTSDKTEARAALSAGQECVKAGVWGTGVV